MSYSLKPQQPIAREIRRIAGKQLALAVADLRATGTPRQDDAVHEARRHVKKVRAVLGLVRPALGDTYDAANRRMRAANRLLAPIADGRAVIDTIARLPKHVGTRRAEPMLTSMRDALVERAARTDRKAELDHVLPKVATILRAERTRVGAWALNVRGFRAIAPGLEKSVRRARKAMARATVHPTPANYHAWRRRVKDLWFHVRLLETSCGDRLVPLQRRLEALDDCLGEYHNVVVLEDVLLSEALLSREHTARSLRLLRRYQQALRRRALVLGRRALAEKPRPLVRRVKRLWQSAKTPRGTRARRASWRPAA